MVQVLQLILMATTSSERSPSDSQEATAHPQGSIFADVCLSNRDKATQAQASTHPQPIEGIKILRKGAQTHKG